MSSVIAVLDEPSHHIFGWERKLCMWCLASFYVRITSSALLIPSFFFLSFFSPAILRSFACSLRYSLTAASAYTREPSIRSSRLRSVHRLLGERRGPQGKDDQSASYWKSVGNLSDICNYPSVWLAPKEYRQAGFSPSLSLSFFLDRHHHMIITLFISGP